MNGLRPLNVHSIALQVPISDLTRRAQTPTDVHSAESIIGIYVSASRRRSNIRHNDGSSVKSGPFLQVSRLGKPLFNEVNVPMSDKDRWNALPPSADNEFVKYVLHPELAALLPVLHPGVFPNLAAYTKPRADLEAILLTGIRPESCPGSRTSPAPPRMTCSGSRWRSRRPRRPASSASSAATSPGSRTAADDIVAIELRAIAGAVLPLVDHTFTADGAAAV